MRILGIDWGEKRIGVAVSDPLQNVAYGVKVIECSANCEERFKKIAEFLEEYAPVEEVVVGLPKTLRGEIGPKAKEVLEFIESLKKIVNAPIKTWDERLSTSAVERPLKGIRISKQKRNKIIDASAAAFILQGYLDHKRRASLCLLKGT